MTSATAAATQGPGAGQSPAGFPVEEHEQHERRDEHRDEIFGPQRAAERRSEQGPIADPAAPEPGMEGETGERPERQLDHVVIELGGGEIEVVHTVDDQDRDQRPERADERARGLPHEDEGDDDDRLGEGVIGGIDAKHPVDDLDQPPWQRRQLVITELPFAAVGQRLDQIERQVQVEDRRQRGPDDGMEEEEGGEGRLRPAFDRVDQSEHGQSRMGLALYRLSLNTRRRPRGNRGVSASGGIWRGDAVRAPCY